ncbi:MAG: hypothetical protein ABSE15_06045 [Candidatus Bathyarchaeia archaeon]
MLEPKVKKQPVIKKSLANHLMDSAIFCCRSNRETDQELDQDSHVVESKEVQRKGIIGRSAKFSNDSLGSWRVAMFPIGSGAFEGEVKYQGETYLIVIVKPNNSAKLGQEGC